MKKPAFAFETPSISAYRMDAVNLLTSLPVKSVDVVVTDPAYSGMNQHLQLGHGRIVGKYEDKGNSGKWFKEFEDTAENYDRFLSACYHALSDDGHLYLMFDSFSLLTLAPLVRNHFDVKNIIVWDKATIGMGHNFRRRHEFIIFATKGGKRKLSKRNIPDVWRFKRITRAKYPTQKPVEIFEAMLLASCRPGDMVCDPFLGSGSSAIASVKRKCRFVGGDIATESLTTTRARIKELLATGVDPLQPRSALAEKEDYNWFIDDGIAK